MILEKNKPIMIRKILTLFVITASVAKGWAQLKPVAGLNLDEKLGAYKTIRLNPDLTGLKPEEREALKYLIIAAQYADSIYWRQTYGNPANLFGKIQDEKLKRYVQINYGPWDRLNGNAPFIQGVGPKPKGANFYPKNIRKSEFDSLSANVRNDAYSILQRGPSLVTFESPVDGDPNTGSLDAMPYGMVYMDFSRKMMENLMYAADKLGQNGDKDFKNYLRMRANNLMNNNFTESDKAWLKVKNSSLDIIIGPIENYEDEFAGVRAAHESFVLIRDKEWGSKLDKFIDMLPDLQKNLPVDSIYKTENAGSGQSQLAVFDAVYYAGDANAGSKTIAVNLPNDETLQTEFGTRRSQLKNVMKAKFDNILVPISNKVIDPSQRVNITWDAFFNDVMFHEVAHGLGIKNTIDKKGTVREALGANYSAVEECKADVLGLWMVTQMVNKNELKGKLDDYYVTFVASVFRSVRFGASNSHGQANMITFNTLLGNGAITRSASGTYKVDVAKMRTTIEKLAGDLLKLQGDGNAETVKIFLSKMATVSPKLAADLTAINNAGIPKDLIFEQGLSVLGLK